MLGVRQLLLLQDIKEIVHRREHARLIKRCPSEIIIIRQLDRFVYRIHVRFAAHNKISTTTARVSKSYPITSVFKQSRPYFQISPRSRICISARPGSGASFLVYGHPWRPSDPPLSFSLSDSGCSICSTSSDSAVIASDDWNVSSVVPDGT